jgi:hypothetical protein
VRITVTAFSGGSPPIVAFETTFGSGAGCWTTELPTPGRSYHVEFEIEDELAWGQQVRLASGDGVSLAIVGGDVRIRAGCEAVDGGLVTLSVGGSLLMVEVADAPVDLAAGTVVEVVLEKQAIRLFPYEL